MGRHPTDKERRHPMEFSYSNMSGREAMFEVKGFEWEGGVLRQSDGGFPFTTDVTDDVHGVDEQGKGIASDHGQHPDP